MADGPETACTAPTVAAHRMDGQGPERGKKVSNERNRTPHFPGQKRHGVGTSYTRGRNRTGGTFAVLVKILRVRSRERRRVSRDLLLVTGAPCVCQLPDFFLVGQMSDPGDQSLGARMEAADAAVRRFDYELADQLWAGNNLQVAISCGVLVIS